MLQSNLPTGTLDYSFRRRLAHDELLYLDRTASVLLSSIMQKNANVISRRAKAFKNVILKNKIEMATNKRALHSKCFKPRTHDTLPITFNVQCWRASRSVTNMDIKSIPFRSCWIRLFIPWEWFQQKHIFLLDDS